MAHATVGFFRQTALTWAGAIVINTQYLLGLGGWASLWEFNVLLGLAGITQLSVVDTWLLGSGRHGLWLRLAVHTAIAMALAYLSGWGPVLGIVIVIVAAINLRTAGSRAWLPSIVLGAIGVAVGEYAVDRGTVISHIPLPRAHVSAALGLATAVLVVAVLGQIFQRQESEAQERAAAQDALRRSEERLLAIVQDSSDVVIIADVDGRLTYVSPAIGKVLGLEYRRVDRFDPEDCVLVHPQDLPLVRTMWQQLALGGREQRSEFRLRQAGGSWRWFEAAARNLLDNPAVRGLVLNIRDITERRMYQERLAYDATHDSLTGLVNRATFLRIVDEACERTDLAGSHVAVLFIDLDGFKQVNDLMGHEAGDKLLRGVAEALRRSARDSDLVARLGGDEFAIMLPLAGEGPAPPDAAEAIAVSDRIIEEFAAVTDPCHGASGVRGSIGIATTGNGSTNGDRLIREADAAMYRAKRSGDGGWRISRPGHDGGRGM